TVIYTVVFSVSAKFYRNPFGTPSAQEARVAILIPAYKEDGVIVSVAQKMMQLNYSKENYTVFVIADQLKDATISALRSTGVTVVPVSFETSTKAKSLNYCLERISDAEFDMVLISDADNILASNFLQKINNAFQQGAKVIQGRRVAKNLDSDYAVLDAASEIINNHIFRKGPNSLGMSASLIGSGMAFSTTEIKAALADIKAIGGFDKVLQLNVIGRGHRIVYLAEALIFDEKVSDSSNFKNQRKRWLASQYIYLFKFMPSAFSKLLKGDFDYFNIAVLHNLFLPRVLNVGLLFMLMILAFALNTDKFLGVWPWFLLFVIYLLSLLIALPLKFFNKKLLFSVISLPGAFLNMFLLLFRLKGADKNFIHTEHNKTDIDNSIFSSEDEK
ncbi:MAG: cellulose synthase/poly-beta-1,6-N-acetylglucosamine synthase-like glycosyltransferase, partial [Parvicella sp.]